MKNKNVLLFHFTNLLVLLLFSEIELKAQEVLMQLDGNPSVQKLYKEQKKNKDTKEVDTLELPFFEDFSTSDIFPNPVLWSDKDAFINGTYPIDPPSIGVATFDAINSKGEFYEDADYINYFFADKLTSNPINLLYPGDKSIYISFYCQPGGKGDVPEAGDSLELQFYAPESKVWNTVWQKEGSGLTDFKQFIVQVYPDKYLKKGFKFRFRNIVSLSSSQQASSVVNADHWNIDYIRLNKNRSANDTLNTDVAFAYPMKSLLKNYESIPWKHFINNRSDAINQSMSFPLRNNDIVDKHIIDLSYQFHDNSGDQDNLTITAGDYDLVAEQYSLIDPPFNPTDAEELFRTNTTDSASFTIKSNFSTNTGDILVNNTLSYTQKFYDYYSYDDGSAEAGYGLVGEGTQNALVAYKFDCKKQDTLKAVQMYFNRSLFDKSQKYFYLTIWDDNDGIPGQIIYSKEGLRPEYEDELNKFHTYFIDDTTLVLNRVFYVGWQQTTTDLLNIGFDVNRNRSQNIFYNINGTWLNTRFEGALMIRTFFGNNLTTGVKPEIAKSLADVKIFPNPASENITVQVGKAFNNKQVTVSIYNLTGTIVHQSLQDNNVPVNLSKLCEGVYIIRLSTKNKSLNYSSKLIKIK